MTAGNANEWGDDTPKNRFTDPDTGEAYFLIIDKETGKTKIYLSLIHISEPTRPY